MRIKNIIKSKNLLSLNCIAIFGLLVLMPLFDALARVFDLPGSGGSMNWTQHLTLWIGLAGAVVAANSGGHLSISLIHTVKASRSLDWLDRLVALSGIAVLIFLTYASIDLVLIQSESPEAISGWFPVWLAQAAMPAGFILMIVPGLKRVYTAGGFWLNTIWLLIFAVSSLLLIWLDYTIILVVILILLAAGGLPIYAVIAGLALLLFSTEQIPLAIVPAEMYQMVTQPVLPSIPLFILAGTILAAGGAPQRLLRLINAWTGWMRGGNIITAVVACALFTAITGASGVTIMAMGGLLLPLLVINKKRQQFGIGLLTASGSVGLLFPPSLPVILYGVYAQVAIDELFLAALVPGIILVMLLVTYSIWRSGRENAVHQAFNLKDAVDATTGSLADMLLPVIVIGGFFGGLLTIVETAAMTALWAIILETVIFKKPDTAKNLKNALNESAKMTGALLLILGIALSFVAYLVDARIPLQAAAWVQTVIQSKWVFLLVVNLMLLLVGALMDIFSAIVIFVPLLVPVGLAFDVDPIHLGIIFLANLELGYLTPPIGINLFLASLRFKKPLFDIWKTVIPFLIIFAVWVLLITYVPDIIPGIVAK